MFLVSDEVAAAVASGSAAVGLETSVIGQGLPSPQNRICLERMETAIREVGAVPAWVGVVDGIVRVGLDRRELARFTEPGAATKVARRDLSAAVATGALGATTVSATVWAAHRGGIAVVATGGIGGVHPGAHPDVSADLAELARTPVLVVCSGPKSIVDPPATAERLEELGVTVVGFGVDKLPFFLSRQTDVPLEHRVDGPEEAAAIVAAHRSLGDPGAILLCNPVPYAHALDRGELLAATARAQERLESGAVRGKEVTPFLLAALAEETRGRSLEANLALLQDNARVAAEVAGALSATTSAR